MRVRCVCGCRLFFLHVPPSGTQKADRVTYLICDNCRKLWVVRDLSLPEVDGEGVFKPEAEAKP